MELLCGAIRSTGYAGVIVIGIIGVIIELQVLVWVMKLYRKIFKK